MKKLTFLVSLILIASLTANAQGWLNKLGDAAKNAAKRTVENRVEKKAADETDKAMDKLEKKGKKKDKNQSEDSGSNTSDEGINGNGKSASLQSYSKFDFVPGEKVIFFDDFTQDAIGDFPALYNTNGSGEIVTTNLYPGNWMKYVSSDGTIWTDKLLKLPDNYTVEFDVIPIKGTEGGMGGWSFRLMKCINEKSWDGGAVPGKAGFEFGVEYFGRAYYRAYNNNLDGNFWDQKGNNDDKNTYEKENQKYHISVWVQKTRVRIYQNETKMFDAPRAFPDAAMKMDRLRFEEGAAMISNIRIAVGAPDMRNKLITEGKLVTYGIYFDVNKDVVKPESYGTLKDIAAVLNEVPDVKVKIVGHTDSDGDDASNLDLSKRRSASVKAELKKNFNVNGDRLVTDGMGETKPIAPNDTPVNKALNRRVEFIKQ